MFYKIYNFGMLSYVPVERDDFRKILATEGVVEFTMSQVVNFGPTLAWILKDDLFSDEPPAIKTMSREDSELARQKLTIGEEFFTTVKVVGYPLASGDLPLEHTTMIFFPDKEFDFK